MRVPTVSVPEVIDEFARRHPRRLQLADNFANYVVFSSNYQHCSRNKYNCSNITMKNCPDCTRIKRAHPNPFLGEDPQTSCWALPFQKSWLRYTANDPLPARILEPRKGRDAQRRHTRAGSTCPQAAQRTLWEQEATPLNNDVIIYLVGVTRSSMFAKTSLATKDIT